jgi:hypothetical protein
MLGSFSFLLPATTAAAQHLMNRPRRADRLLCAAPLFPLPILPWEVA